jgi:hypothetical protein
VGILEEKQRHNPNREDKRERERERERTRALTRERQRVPSTEEKEYKYKRDRESTRDRERETTSDKSTRVEAWVCLVSHSEGNVPRAIVEETTGDLQEGNAGHRVVTRAGLDHLTGTDLAILHTLLQGRKAGVVTTLEAYTGTNQKVTMSEYGASAQEWECRVRVCAAAAAAERGKQIERERAAAAKRDRVR